MSTLKITPETYIWELEAGHPEAARVLHWHGITNTRGLDRLTLSSLSRLYDIELPTLLQHLRATAPEAPIPEDGIAEQHFA